jgi:5-methylcytosine-specific restriction enzyme subunit McrC
VTGFVKVGNLNIEIVPKFLGDKPFSGWQSALWNILVAVDPGLNHGIRGTFTDAASTSLPDLLGQVLLRSLREARLEGLPRSYRRVRGRLRVLRGRLDTRDGVAMLTRPDLLPCVFDVFDVDNPINRLIRWAGMELSRDALSGWLGAALYDEAIAMGEIASEPPNVGHAERLTLPIQNSSLAPALVVARLVLLGRGGRFGGRDMEAPGFLWNSAYVFQEFCALVLWRALRRLPGTRLERHRVPLAVPDDALDASLQTEPDMRICIGSQTALLLDAKYKTFAGQPLSSDAYQVIAGGRAVGCRHVVLLYPGSGQTRHRSWLVAGTGVPERVHVEFLDLARMVERGAQRHLAADLAEALRPMMG